MRIEYLNITLTIQFLKKYYLDLYLTSFTTHLINNSLFELISLDLIDILCILRQNELGISQG